MTLGSLPQKGNYFLSARLFYLYIHFFYPLSISNLSASPFLIDLIHGLKGS